MLAPRRDVQTATPDGQLVHSLIDGVVVRLATTLPDERGEVCEVYDPAWGLSGEPLVYAYQVTIRPQKVKGWVVHHEQDDRLFCALGVLKIVLYDGRQSSPTYGTINEIVLSERNRGLVIIPRGVFHAIQNVGTTDALFFNLPTRPYNHAAPDKYRLPLDTDQIPYQFAPRLGWCGGGRRRYRPRARRRAAGQRRHRDL
jgi:dTDP-4-dehydrorhamnose 3,5-epimerase